MLRAFTYRIRAGEVLTRDDARSAFESVCDHTGDPALVQEFIAALATRGESASEITGAADALRSRMIAFEHDHPGAIDTCGTGGDGLSTFNVSTAAAIVAAACGARVVKHGNRSQSSRCGSADVLERLGLPLEVSADRARRVLDEVGITFLYAPAFHPALARVAGVRRALGIRTVFNFCGPLCNPGRVRRQIVGVPTSAHVDVLADVLRELRHVSAYVVHGAGGADELTLAGSNRAEPIGRAPRERYDADALGLAAAPDAALAGGDATHNARQLQALLAGERGAVRDAVILNTSAALVVAEIAATAHEGVALAREALDSGRARALFERWIDATGAQDEQR